MKAREHRVDASGRHPAADRDPARDAGATVPWVDGRAAAVAQRKLGVVIASGGRRAFADRRPRQPADVAREGVVQAKGLARIRTRPDPARGRVIEAVEFEGRMPTNVEGAQGHHTVASALITGSAAALEGKTRSEAIFHLRQLAMQTLTNDLVAGRGNNITVPLLFGLLDRTEHLIATHAEGEDINAALEDAFETYIRLANKRADTALEGRGETPMGGREAEGLRILRELKVHLEHLEPGGAEFTTFARGCVLLVDFVPTNLLQIDLLAAILVRAIDHALHLVDDTDLGLAYEALPDYVVAAWLARARQLARSQATLDLLDQLEGAGLTARVADGVTPVYEDEDD
jgi:hypothetical protein